MKPVAPEFSALIIILRSTGPVISVRRFCSFGGTGIDLPVALADLPGLGQEVERLAGGEGLAALGAAREQLGAARPEAVLELAHELQGVVGQHLGVPAFRRDRQRDGHGVPPLVIDAYRISIGCTTGSSCPSSRAEAAICSTHPGLAAATASAPVASRFLRLALPELLGGLGLEQVVDAGRAAAQLPLGGLDELEAGDRAQQVARLRAHALGVGQVAGVVVGDLRLERVAHDARLVLGQHLGDVADLLRRTPRPARPSRGRRAGRARSPSSPSRSRRRWSRRRRSPRRRRSSAGRARGPGRRRRRGAAARRSSAACAGRGPRSPRPRAPRRSCG